MWARRLLSHTVAVDAGDPAVLAQLEPFGRSGTPAGRRLAFTVTGADVYENGDWLATVAAGTEAAELIVDRSVRVVVDYVGRTGWLPLAATAVGRSLVLGGSGLVAARHGRVADAELPGPPPAPGPRLVGGAAMEAVLAWAIPCPLAPGAAVAEAAALLRAGVEIREQVDNTADPDGLQSRANGTGGQG